MLGVVLSHNACRQRPFAAAAAAAAFLWSQLNLCSFLAYRVFDSHKAAQAGGPGVPFNRIVDEARYLTIPAAKVWCVMQCGPGKYTPQC